MSDKTKRYSLGEEIFSGVSHGIGALIGVITMTILIVFAAQSGDVIAVLSVIVYGISMILLYTFSTLYHSITNNTAKKVFRVLDHSSIFIFIAGTYTPFCLVTLRGEVGYRLFAVVWAAAIVGIILNCFNIEKFKYLSMGIYLIMGWVVVTAINPLLETLPPAGFYLLLAGGICYTVGVIFYAIKIKWMHGIWHLFCLGGTVTHFLSILLFVIIK